MGQIKDLFKVKCTNLQTFGGIKFIFFSYQGSIMSDILPIENNCFGNVDESRLGKSKKWKCESTILYYELEIESFSLSTKTKICVFWPFLKPKKTKN